MVAREHFGNMMFYFPDGFVYFKLPGIVDNCNVISCLTAIWRHSNDARVLNAIGIDMDLQAKEAHPNTYSVFRLTDTVRHYDFGFRFCHIAGSALI